MEETKSGLTPEMETLILEKIRHLAKGRNLAGFMVERKTCCESSPATTEEQQLNGLFKMHQARMTAAVDAIGEAVSKAYDRDKITVQIALSLVDELEKFFVNVMGLAPFVKQHVSGDSSVTVNIDLGSAEKKLDELIAAVKKQEAEREPATANN